MAYLIPIDTPTPQMGDVAYWEGYAMIESAIEDGVAAHHLLVQARLILYKNHPNTVDVKNITTIEYNCPAPVKNCFLTTIHFSIIGSPLAFPDPNV